VVPHDSAVNFTGKSIVFNFDEYVVLDNAQQNIIISPTPKINPVIDSKLRTVSIKLKDTLQPNTTYFLDFGKAIKDNNEGNVLKNFSYVFSTGAYLDSLEFGGNVLIAETGKKDSSLIVVLHKNLDDSAVVHDRPRYVARLDSNGNFMFHHLAPGYYNLFALKDEGGTRKYLSKGQLFAFYDKPITIQQVNLPVTLFAYSEKEEVKKPAAKTTTAKKEEKEKRLVLQANLTNSILDLLDSLKIQFQMRLKTFDSTKVHFKDGAFKDIVSYQLIKDTADKKLTIITKWLPDSPYRLILEKEFAEDSLGRKLLKADTISFRTKKESDYGEVRLRFRNLDLSKNPVLQFVQNKAVKFSYPLTTTQLIKKLVVPGDYDLRILYDDNKNGVWDPGEFFVKHLQPEKVILVPIRNKKKIFTVKASWENDLDITL
jgi:Bacterial Ig-like domain